MSVAGVAHPVERHLAKVEVASSSLVTRSIKNSDCFAIGVFSLNPSAGRKKSPLGMKSTVVMKSAFRQEKGTDLISSTKGISSAKQISPFRYKDFTIICKRPAVLN